MQNKQNYYTLLFKKREDLITEYFTEKHKFKYIVISLKYNTNYLILLYCINLEAYCNAK